MEGFGALHDSLRQLAENPPEPAQILKLSRRMGKRFDEYRREYGLRPFKVAILGSNSTQHLASVLRTYLAAYALGADIYDAPYNSIRAQIMDEGSELYSTAPEAALILPYYRDVRDMPPLLSGTDDVSEFAHDFAKSHYALLSTLHERLPGCQLISGNIALPPLRPLGAQELAIPASAANALHAVNAQLVLRRPTFVSLLDLDYLSAVFGKQKWFDMRGYYLSKQGCALEALPLVARDVAATVAARLGLMRKCLVLDLDNTLWGGVVGDDGALGINLDPNDAVGEAYRDFQRYCRSLKERGVLLAACSKNDDANAKAPFAENPNMVLKLDDFAAFVANWDDKATNLQRIANELNIGLDALVFADDNPAERHRVRQALPQVCTVELGADVADYAASIDALLAFDALSVTNEDLSRTQSFAAARERDGLKQATTNMSEYLRSLYMRIRCHVPDKRSAGRFSQLIARSNQFNLRTKRYSEGEILSLMESNDHMLIALELTDRFEPLGIISCLILQRRGSDAFVDTWVMSCRVLGRGVEEMARNALTLGAKRLGCTRVVGEYIETAKNRTLTRSLYPQLGFEPIGAYEDEAGDCYALSVEAPLLENTIRTEYEFEVND